jgi:mono/diheme cytochrome c family protein
MRVSRLAWLVSSLVVIGGCGSAPGAAATPKTTPAAPAAPAAKGGVPSQVTPERIAKGKELFHNGSCYRCHAKDGAGSQNAPSLNDKNWLHGDGTYAQIANIIISGFLQSDMIGGYGRAMPPRGQIEQRGVTPSRLTDDEVASLAAYVYSISHDM